MKNQNQFYKKVGKSKKAMIEFLTNHFRYSTANSWNNSTSYANNVKIYRVIPSELQNKVFEMMDAEGFYDEINWLLSDFDLEHGYTWQVGFNGRSGGYIVLYTGGTRDGKPFSYPGKSVDMGEDFTEWSAEDLQERVKLVQEFDRLCDDVVNQVIYMATEKEVKEETYTIKKTRKVLA